jgi:type IV secretory pathway ATPase VirB11/archaellum biosynthesis ATPase
MKLEHNPFCTRHVRPGAIPFRFPGGLDAKGLADRLEANGWRGQIVGPHGSGKSTLLEALMPELRRRRTVVRVELHDRERRLPPEVWATGEGTLLVIDGYEQLGWWTRRRVRRHCRELLVTTHRGQGLPDLYRTDVTAELVGEIVQGLHADAVPDLVRRLAHHRGNLREVLFELYDRYEERRTVFAAIPLNEGREVGRGQ